MTNTRIRHVLGLALAAALLPTTTGCVDDTEPAGPAVGGIGVVRGTVARLKTGDGVPNLIVAIVDDGTVLRAAPTDAAGNFEFPSVPTGDYMVHLTGFELAGVSLRSTAFTPQEQRVVVEDAGADVSFAAVGLIPPRVVGEVTCGGALVEGASVRVVGGGADTTVTTSPQGKYGATDLDPGYYTVMLMEAPCPVEPFYQVVFVNPGQAAEANFSG